MKEKAIIYTRVSTDEQADRGYSLRDQEDRLRKYCELKNIEVFAHYQDDHSAKSFDRPEFNKMLAFIKANKRQIDSLYFVKWDRFSRNTTDSYSMLKTLDSLGIKVQAVEQPVDISIPEQKIMLAFYLTSPEVENDRRALNTRNGMRRAMKEGRWVNKAPLGYLNRRNERNEPILIVDEPKAKFIRKAFEVYSKGNHGLEELRRLLGEEGFKVSRNNFNKLMKNNLYAGMILVPAWKKEDEQLVLGLHEAIISKSLFEKCQLIIKGKRNKVKTKCRDESLPLRGHILCTTCNNIMTGSRSRGNGGYYFYYHCMNGCKNRISTKDAHNTIENIFTSIVPKQGIVQLYYKIMEDLMTDRKGDDKKEMARIKLEINELNEKLIKLDEKFIEDQIEKDSYDRLKNKYNGDLRELQTKQYAYDEHESDYSAYLESGMTLLTHMADYWKRANVTLKQRLLSSIFPEKLRYENKSLRTNKINKVIEDITLRISTLGVIKKGKINAFNISSPLAARRGFEPLLPG